MENKSLKKALDKASEILQFAFDHVNEPINIKNEKEILARLDALEKEIHELDKRNEELFKDTKVNEFTVQMMMSDTKNERISEDQRELLNRAQELKNYAEAASKNLLKTAQAANEADVDLTGKSKKSSGKSGKSRKNKFRSMGGTKNWKPL